MPTYKSFLAIEKMNFLSPFFVPKMGISEIFTDHADIGGLSNTKQKMKVDKVIHKAYFDVGGYEGAPRTRKLYYFYMR